MDATIKSGTVVRVKNLTEELPENQRHLQGRLGLVYRDSPSGTLVLVDFLEGKIEQFHRDVLTIHKSVDDPRYQYKYAVIVVKNSAGTRRQWSDPKKR